MRRERSDHDSGRAKWPLPAGAGPLALAEPNGNGSFEGRACWACDSTGREAVPTRIANDSSHTKVGSPLFWTHSYTKSTAAAPIVTEVNGVPTLSWRLSEPSPRTWWGVMRSVDGGPFERVARVRAGPGEALSWADSSAPTDARIEYAIRRESRDVRYQVTSGAATWEPRRAVLELSIRGPNPSSPRLELEVVGASAGPLEARVYDLQGRVVASQQFRALGSGRDVLTLSLGRAVPSGLYIVGVRSHDGRRGTHRKLLLVR